MNPWGVTEAIAILPTYLLFDEGYVMCDIAKYWCKRITHEAKNNSNNKVTLWKNGIDVSYKKKYCMFVTTDTSVNTYYPELRLYQATLPLD